MNMMPCIGNSFCNASIGLLLAITWVGIPSSAFAQTFSNPQPIVIPPVESSPFPPAPNGFTRQIAAPYPSTIDVTGVERPFVIEVDVHGLFHTAPGKIDMLLVSAANTPTRSVLLMDGTGGAADIANVNLTFRDDAPNFPFPIVSGVYSPSNIGSNPSFIEPAPFR